MEFRLTPEQVDLLTLEQLRTMITQTYWISAAGGLFESSRSVVATEHYEIQVGCVGYTGKESVHLTIDGRCFIPAQPILRLLGLPSTGIAKSLSRNRGKARRKLHLVIECEKSDLMITSARVLAKVLIVLQARRDEKIQKNITRQLDKMAKESA